MIQPAPLAASIHDGAPVTESFAPHVGVKTFLSSADGRIVELDAGSTCMSDCVLRAYTRGHEY
jgi:hypothetical protein